MTVIVPLSLPHGGAVSWSVMNDCGISWSYSLTFFIVSNYIGPLGRLAFPLEVFIKTCSSKIMCIKKVKTDSSKTEDLKNFI